MVQGLVPQRAMPRGRAVNFAKLDGINNCVNICHHIKRWRTKKKTTGKGVSSIRA